ncbi:hypothetical protein SLE2022_371380 [Rubroshorea leprosula]
MASAASMIGAGFCFGNSSVLGLKQSPRCTVRPRRMVVVRAEGQTINSEIRKNEEKVVDAVVITELSKPSPLIADVGGQEPFPCVMEAM